MNNEDTNRDANLQYLKEHAPHVFAWIDHAVRRLGDSDIEQLVRYARWLEEHQRDNEPDADGLIREVRARRMPTRRANSSHIQ